MPNVKIWMAPRNITLDWVFSNSADAGYLQINVNSVQRVYTTGTPSSGQITINAGDSIDVTVYSESQFGSDAAASLVINDNGSNIYNNSAQSPLFVTLTHSFTNVGSVTVNADASLV